MIKIKKDNTELTVSKGTYNSMFKSLGYTIVSNKKETVVEPKKEEVVAEPVETAEIVEIVEEPKEETKVTKNKNKK